MINQKKGYLQFEQWRDFGTLPLPQVEVHICPNCQCESAVRECLIDWEEIAMNYKAIYESHAKTMVDRIKLVEEKYGFTGFLDCLNEENAKQLQELCNDIKRFLQQIKNNDLPPS